MRLNVNPHSLIARPKFGDLNGKEDTANQWKMWRKGVKDAVEVFKRLQILKAGDERKVQGLLSGSRAYAVSAVRGWMNLPQSVSGEAILEGIERYLSTDGSVDKEGYREWESKS